MKTYEITITGSGTSDQIATSLLAIARDLQVTNVHGGEVERETEDPYLMCTITEE